MKPITALLVSSLTLALSGCSTLQAPPTPPAEDIAMQRLNHVAARAQATLQELADIQHAKAQSQITLLGAERAAQTATVTPPGWEKKVAVHFQGPFEPLVKRLAAFAQYRVVTEGRAPANSPLVTVKGRHTPLITYLRDTAAQLPSSIRIQVYASTRTVVITYRAPGA